MWLATPTAATAATGAWIQAGFTAAVGQSLHEHTQSEGSSHTQVHSARTHAHTRSSIQDGTVTPQ